jgi:hypothetical protein
MSVMSQAGALLPSASDQSRRDSPTMRVDARQKHSGMTAGQSLRARLARFVIPAEAGIQPPCRRDSPAMNQHSGKGTRSGSPFGVTT